MKVIVIGKNGQLANELMVTAPENYKVVTLGRNEIDLLNEEDITNKVKQYHPQFIINTAAYTAVDKAEDNEKEAFAINEIAVKNLAKLCAKNDIRLIHISTDFVFDGTADEPYEPCSITNPINVYGKSKLAGERAVLKYAPNKGCIIRTSWLYSSFGNNFVKTMLRLMQEGKTLSVVSDQMGSPTWAKGLARFIWEVTTLATVEPLYHWADKGISSWYDFAICIHSIAGELGLLSSESKITPIAAINYGAPAKRPTNSVLNCEKSTHVLQPLEWQKNLTSMLTQLKNQ